MLTLGRFLQIDLINSLMPAYASYLAFELHKMNATFYVTVSICLGNKKLNYFVFKIGSVQAHIGF